MCHVTKLNSSPLTLRITFIVMSTITITLSTYNSVNMHVNDVNMQHAEVYGWLLVSRREPPSFWVTGATTPTAESTAGRGRFTAGLAYKHCRA
jgi:hypothetical protein